MIILKGHPLLQVCTNEEQEVLDRGSKKSEKLRHQLMNVAGGSEILPNMSARMNKGYEKAAKHKDKLLEYDKTRLVLKQNNLSLVICVAISLSLGWRKDHLSPQTKVVLFLYPTV